MTRQQTVEQERAKQAWDNIQSIQADKNKYGSLARRLPSLLQTNGLGQTLAFLRSKAKGKAATESEHQTMYQHLSVWVMKKMGQPDDKQKKMLMEWIIKQPSPIYRRATAEAMAFAQWLKRFAEAEGLGSEQGED